MITRAVWAEIDLSAMRHNINQAKLVVGNDVHVMAVVKANGYGHGAVPAAKAACEAGATWLGVAITEEGIELRNGGLEHPILVLAEPSIESIPIGIVADLRFTVCSMRIARALSSAASQYNKIATIHIKVDTGMNRIGLRPVDVPDFIQEIRKLDGIKIEGIFTHFAEADNPRSDYTNKQLKQFNELLKKLENMGLCPRVRHAANSAATYLYPGSHFDMVRIGISMYGLHPSEATIEVADLKPALSLKARLTCVKSISLGEGVSYNRTFRAPSQTVIGTVPIGYGDGYSRLLSNKSDVLWKGVRYPAVGNICMDQFMVELGPKSDAKVDDEVVLIGRQNSEYISVDEIARILGTINYEVVCMIQARVPRTYT